jgi:hypothetical protein
VNEVKEVKEVSEVLAARVGMVSKRGRSLVDARRPAWNRWPEYVGAI